MRGYYKLIVYCDQLLKLQMFANTYIAHLGYIAPDYATYGGTNKTFLYEPPNVEYKEIIPGIIEQNHIRLDVADELGRNIKYTDAYLKSGAPRLTVTLHFKYFR